MKEIEKKERKEKHVSKQMRITRFFFLSHFFSSLRSVELSRKERMDDGLTNGRQV
jgi:hypothetical protein